MTQEQMLKLVESQERAYNARDLEAFCQCFHPEIEIQRLISGIGSKGIEKFREGFQQLFSSSPNLHSKIKSRIVLEFTIIDEEWITGATNFPKGLHTVAIYGFRDGLIDRVWFPR